MGLLPLTTGSKSKWPSTNRMTVPKVLEFSTRWWFSPRSLGKWSNLTSIFFKCVESWNHQLVNILTFQVMDFCWGAAVSTPHFFRRNFAMWQMNFPAELPDGQRNPVCLAWGIGVYRVNPPGVCGLDGWDMAGEILMVKVCATKTSTAGRMAQGWRKETYFCAWRNHMVLSCYECFQGRWFHGMVGDLKPKAE